MGNFFNRYSKASSDKKNLASNFFSLSALQAVNMILPLITLPYLVRVLGVEKFGLVNFALSIIMYFTILVSFGFGLSATREISINRDNPKKISEIFCAVMLIKISLLLISLATISILISTVETFRSNAFLYFATFGVVIGDVIFPTWFFQGMEKMKYITYVNVISKVLFTVLIFVFIKETSDYIYVPVLNSLGIILGGSYALWLVFKLFNVKIIYPKKAIILEQFRGSFQFFLSRVANNGSRYFATTVIGIYFGNVVVGYYSMAEKLFYAFMSLGSVVSQTIYPYMARTKNLQFLRKVLTGIIIISIVLLIPIMYFNKELLYFIFEEQSEMLSLFFIIIFSGAIFAIISTIIGYPLLAAFGYIKYANNSLIYSSIIYIIYTATAIYFTNNIYIVVFAVPVYMVVGLGLRIYYIYKSKLLVKEGL